MDLEKAKTVLQVIDYNLPSGIIPFRQPDGGTREIFRISKAVDSNLYTLDLMLCTGSLTEQWENRQLMILDGQEIKVVSREGLIKMKREAGRDQDLVDIKRLESNE